MEERMRHNRGLSALPTILLLSGIILEVVIAGLAVSMFFSRSLLSEQLSVEALKAAESGANDAIIRVTDYINCPTVGANTYCPDVPYEITVGDRTACINIGAISGGKMTIYSKGTAFTREKTIEAVLGITTTEGRVEVQSFKEIETPGGFVDC